MIRDDQGNLHDGAGRFSQKPRGASAGSLDAPSLTGPVTIERAFDDEYRLQGYAPAPGAVIFALEQRAHAARTGYDIGADNEEEHAYLAHLERIGRLDVVEAAAGDLEEPYEQHRWLSRMEAVQAACAAIEPTPRPSGELHASEGYLGATKVTGSMHDGAAMMGLSDAEVNKLIRTDLKHAKESGYLCDAAKISVRKHGSGAYIQVSVAGIPRGLVWHPGDPYDQMDPRPKGRTDYGNELEARIKVVAGAYGRDDTNSQADYFNAHRVPIVTFVFDEPEAPTYRDDPRFDPREGTLR